MCAVIDKGKENKVLTIKYIVFWCNTNYHYKVVLLLQIIEENPGKNRVLYFKITGYSPQVLQMCFEALFLCLSTCAGKALL